MTSKLFRVNWNDLLKALAIVVIGAAATTIYSFVSNSAVIDWMEVLRVSVAAGLFYLIKNFFSESTPTTETVLGVKLDKSA